MKVTGYSLQVTAGDFISPVFPVTCHLQTNFMRISGISIPDDKHLALGLTAVYGIGRTRALKALAAVHIAPTKRAKELTADEELALRKEIEKFTIEGELRREIGGNIKRLKDINSYRGLRHASNLPSRGQRTRTNARMRRGKKVTVGGTAKKAASKT